MSEQRAPPSDWATWLPCVTLAINNTVADATGTSPNSLVLGHNIAMPVDHALDVSAPNLSASDLADRMVQVTAAARDAVNRAASRAALYANKHRRELQFGVGERVLLAIRNLRLLGSPKFR